MASRDESIGWQFVQACRAHRNYTDALLNNLGLHVGQEMLLLHLGDVGEISKSELAGRLGVQPPTVTRMLQRMEAAGLVETRADPQDARASLVYLSQQGVDLQTSIREALEQVDHQTLIGLTAAEVATLHDLLGRVRLNLAAVGEVECEPAC